MGQRLWGLYFVLFYFFFLMASCLSSSKALAFNDWPMFMKDPSHSGLNSDETGLKPPFQIKWVFPGYSFSSAAVSQNSILVRTGGFLYSLNSLDGDINWSYNYSQPTPHTSPAIDGNTVYIGNRVGPGNTCINCSLQALDLSTGIVRWEIKLSRGALDPTISDGVVYFGSDDGYMRAVDASSGQLLWISSKLGNGVLSIPAVSEGKVFGGTDTGMFYVLDSSTGEVLWNYSLGGLIFSSPSVVNGVVYIGSGLNYVYAFDVSTGNPKWIFTQAGDSVWGSPAVAAGKVFIQDLAGNIYALDAENGNLIWSYKTAAKPSSSYSSPAVANGIVYIGSQDGNVYGFNSDDGNVMWQFNTGGPVFASPAVSNNHLYIGSSSGNFYSFENLTIAPTPSPSPTPYPFLDVPNIKQYSSPWASKTYDKAGTWSPQDPTIKRWGCALTSASMILHYFNHPINPGNLNDWLNLQPDGYLRNGLLNWISLSRYTKENADADSPILEFKRQQFTPDNLDSSLSQNIPGILKVPGHFFIATGKLLSTYTINDPASEKGTIPDLWVPYELNTFMPSQTDLSYLLLVLNPDIDLKIFDFTGQNMNKDIYSSEDFLATNDEGGIFSSEHLTVFTYSKPPEGIYELLLSGPLGKSFTLDTYIYNHEGVVSKYSTSNTLNGRGEYKAYLSIYANHPDVFTNIFGHIFKDLNYYEGKCINKQFFHLLKFELHLTKTYIASGKFKKAGRMVVEMKRQLEWLRFRKLCNPVYTELKNDLVLLYNSLLN